MCFSLNIPFKYLIFKCPFLLDLNYFNEQFLSLVASKLGVTHGSVGSHRRMHIRSGLPGGALWAKSHLASQHFGFSVGCYSSGYSSPPCKGQGFLGSACVVVPTAAGGFELCPQSNILLGGETRLCCSGEAGWGKRSSSPWYLCSALTHCRKSWGWCTPWASVPLLPWRKLLLKMFPGYILHFTDFTLNTLLFSPEIPECRTAITFLP